MHKLLSPGLEIKDGVLEGSFHGVNFLTEIVDYVSHYVDLEVQFCSESAVKFGGP